VPKGYPLTRGILYQAKCLTGVFLPSKPRGGGCLGYINKNILVSKIKKIIGLYINKCFLKRFFKKIPGIKIGTFLKYCQKIKKILKIQILQNH